MRLGVLGGTFDPPHVGHLLAAIDALETLGLDRLLLVPAAQQPLKAGRATAPARDRLRMLELLAAADPRLGVDAMEIERDGLSYTVDTVAAYAAGHPGVELFFLAGADVFDTFERWREPARILALARLVVMARAPSPGDGGTGEEARPPTRPAPAEQGRALARRLGVSDDRAPMVIASRRIDVSSTEIRARVREGRSIRGFVPDAVADYVASAGLYR